MSLSWNFWDISGTMMTTESDGVINSEHVLIFLCSILFYRYAMYIARTQIASWRPILNVGKLKRTRNSTLSLFVVIIVVEIFHKFQHNDTVNRHYDDKTAILLFLSAFKLFSAILMVLVSHYLPDEIILFCSRPIVDHRGSVFMEHDNDSHCRGTWNFQNALPPSTSPMSWAKLWKYLWECTLERFA